MSREHRFKSEITCPYCNCEFSDSWEYEFDCNRIKEITCGHCDSDFEVIKNYEVTYCSFKKEGSDE